MGTHWDRSRSSADSCELTPRPRLQATASSIGCVRSGGEGWDTVDAVRRVLQPACGGELAELSWVDAGGGIDREVTVVVHGYFRYTIERCASVDCSHDLEI